MIDGGWFCRILAKSLNKQWPTPQQVVRNALSILAPNEELFRIFYYDCHPYGGKIKNPVDGAETDYSATPAFSGRTQFIKELGQMNGVALRLGELKVRGWNFANAYTQSLSKTPRPPSAQEVYPNFEQKGVDMRIGIDVATLSLKRTSERVILFSGDTDMIPAMKLARREGLQVYIVEMPIWKNAMSRQMIEDSDGVRLLTPAA